MPEAEGVLVCGDLPAGELIALLGRFGLAVETVAAAKPIPGSYWGDPEAGLVGRRLLVRSDTPVHSALHEASHFICMDASRRGSLDTDAGGDDLEECAVCYLQILLAEFLSGVTRKRMFSDMDAWGYSFRLGDTESWFERDANDARRWLVEQGVVGDDDGPTWRARR